MCSGEDYPVVLASRAPACVGVDVGFPSRLCDARNDAESFVWHHMLSVLRGREFRDVWEMSCMQVHAAWHEL